MPFIQDQLTGQDGQLKKFSLESITSDAAADEDEGEPEVGEPVQDEEAVYADDSPP